MMRFCLFLLTAICLGEEVFSITGRWNIETSDGDQNHEIYSLWTENHVVVLLDFADEFEGDVTQYGPNAIVTAFGTESGPTTLRVIELQLEEEAGKDTDGEVAVGRYGTMEAYPARSDSDRPWKILFVMVHSSDSTFTFDEDDIRNHHFGGIPFSDDEEGNIWNHLGHRMRVDRDLNFATQLNFCSHGKLNIQPFNGALGTQVITGGVTSVTLSENTHRATRTDIWNKARTAIRNEFDVSWPPPGIDLVAHIVDVGVLDDNLNIWSAAGYVGGIETIYSDRMVFHNSVVIHELGHNFGLRHSNQNGMTYADTAGYMGFSGDHKCFNAAKSHQLGWYDDKETIWARDQLNREIDLVGVAEYNLAGEERVIVKIPSVTTGGLAWFVGFNRAIGINAGTDKARDQVHITQASEVQPETEFGTVSSLLATLPERGVYENQEGWKIEVLNIDFDSTPSVARIRLECVGGQTQGCQEGTTLQPYVQRTYGTCEDEGMYLIMTQTQCDTAAAFLQLSDVESQDDGNYNSLVQWDPKGCYMEDGRLYFNVNGDNTGDCSVRDTCICATFPTTAASCATFDGCYHSSLNKGGSVSCPSDQSSCTEEMCCDEPATCTGLDNYNLMEFSQVTCASPMTSKGDGYVCDGNYGTCTADLCCNAAVACSADSDCASREFCDSNGYCKATCDSWSGCVNHALNKGSSVECNGNLEACDQLTCCNPAVSCNMDSDCSNGEVCSAAVDGVCVREYIIAESGANCAASGYQDIMSLAECETAARSLDMIDTTVDDDGLHRGRTSPTKCYYRNTGLKYNVRDTNLGSCSASTRCLCVWPSVFGSTSDCPPISGSDGLCGPDHGHAMCSSDNGANMDICNLNTGLCQGSTPMGQVVTRYNTERIPQACRARFVTIASGSCNDEGRAPLTREECSVARRRGAPYLGEVSQRDNSFTSTNYPSGCYKSYGSGERFNPFDTNAICGERGNTCVCRDTSQSATCDQYSCADPSFNKGSTVSCVGDLSTCTESRCCAPRCDQFSCSLSSLNRGASVECSGTTLSSCDDSTCCFMPTCALFNGCADPSLHKGSSSSLVCSGYDVNSCDQATCCNPPATCDEFTGCPSSNPNVGSTVSCAGALSTCTEDVCCAAAEGCSSNSDCDSGYTCENGVCEGLEIVGNGFCITNRGSGWGPYMRSTGSGQTYSYEDCQAICADQPQCFGMRYDRENTHRCYLYTAVQLTGLPTHGGSWYWSGSRPTRVGDITSTSGSGGTCAKKRNTDCAGTFSTCTSACEVASDRTLTMTMPQIGSGAACPTASDCTVGEGTCRAVCSDGAISSSCSCALESRTFGTCSQNGAQWVDSSGNGIRIVTRTSGTCSSYEYQPLSSRAECQAASDLLGHSESFAHTGDTYTSSFIPRGCSIRSLGLYFGSTSNSGSCSTSSECVCKQTISSSPGTTPAASMTLLGSGYCLTSSRGWPAYMRNFPSYSRTLEQCQQDCMSLTECAAIRHYDNNRCMLYTPAAMVRASIAGSWSWHGPRLSSNGPITEIYRTSGHCYVKSSSAQQALTSLAEVESVTSLPLSENVAVRGLALVGLLSVMYAAYEKFQTKTYLPIEEPEI